ncbi:hypothetical protein C1Y08_01095 [Pseudomonas sp. FW306-02-F02-AA]|uniref:Uncharacterized protein n=1 Tax=Pseudomonas fluorescens TaxID=294 RepID=A0A0N9WH96_PSEFL|nr:MULTISPECIES: hypothetical protein [Pseudomonas]ALI04088.1 hypothetical protein AO353_24595 [Pseudomonas fluorescens]PMZ02171.1 hypothetical protein C1Y07_21540 [Pseudomonas sp. FW306-02-F02-AB]PMZ07846.1 hypothetical protein C1Y06_22445 [Pseudomonas sp. FW306-02-H06C]PMZ17936.1 hypothetical protein C1Y08_01095 [Pseudomonas sp. FW306-02-F02-AA]PMZ23969.1 hypothetical protein C1Y09_01100 [Pseudomonas sp. FW306-02-F08-AA]
MFEWTLGSLFSRLQTSLNGSTSRGANFESVELEEDLLKGQLAEVFRAVRVPEQWLKAVLNQLEYRAKFEGLLAHFWLINSKK